MAKLEIATPEPSPPRVKRARVNHTVQVPPQVTPRKEPPMSRRIDPPSSSISPAARAAIDRVVAGDRALSALSLAAQSAVNAAVAESNALARMSDGEQEVMRVRGVDPAAFVAERDRVHAERAAWRAVGLKHATKAAL